MKDKTAAARLLLDAGWTFEEIAAVLDGERFSRPVWPQEPVMPPITIPHIPPSTAAPNRPWWESITTILHSGDQPASS